MDTMGWSNDCTAANMGVKPQKPQGGELGLVLLHWIFQATNLAITNLINLAYVKHQDVFGDPERDWLLFFYGVPFCQVSQLQIISQEVAKLSF